MKKRIILFILIVLALVIPITPVHASGQSGYNRWAVIIGGCEDLTLDTNYLNQVLTEHYNFTEILYLYPQAPKYLNKTIVRWAVRDWLGNRSDSDDLIFIFIDSHGGGAWYYNDTLSLLQGGRWELNSDEAEKYAETGLAIGKYNYIFHRLELTQVGIDFNGNGILENNVYAGVDECIGIQSGPKIGPGRYESMDSYWDDEVKEDLDTLSYRRLIFSFQGCRRVNQTEEGDEMSCFSGGLIRDLSAPNRIIITSTNETSYSWAWAEAPSEPSIGYFSRPFIDALDPLMNASQADTNNDNEVSMWEAFQFAWKNDEARKGIYIPGQYYDELVTETPWLDDNGDGVANWRDGLLSMETSLKSCNLKSPDINNDGYVNIIDLGYLVDAWLTEVGDPNWDERCDLNNDGYVNVVDYGILVDN